MEHQAHSQEQEQAHPQPLEYVKIAVVLAIVTAVEVGLYFTPNDVTFVRAAYVPALLILSAAKFSLVVLWFMHLKFDSRLFSAMFVGGLLLAAAVLIALLFLFQAFTLT